LANDDELKSQNREKSFDLIEIESENETETSKEVAVQSDQTLDISSKSKIQTQTSEETIQTENDYDYQLAEQIQRSISGDLAIENHVTHLNEETDRLLKEKRNIDRLTGSIEKYILDDAKV